MALCGGGAPLCNRSAFVALLLLGLQLECALESNFGWAVHGGSSPLCNRSAALAALFLHGLQLESRLDGQLGVRDSQTPMRTIQKCRQSVLVTVLQVRLGSSIMTCVAQRSRHSV